MNDLFSAQGAEDNFEFIGNGHSLRKTADRDVVLLYKNGQLLKRQQLSPAVEKRHFVVDLVERHGATKIKVAESLGISRQSVDNWVNSYRKHGISGLMNSTKDRQKQIILSIIFSPNTN